MSNFMGKIEEKLHMGGHKKTEPAPDEVQTPAEEQAQAPPAHAPAGEHGDLQPIRPEVFKEQMRSEPVPHQGPLDKIKNKLYGGKKEGGEAYQVQDL